MKDERLIQEYEMKMCAPGCHPGADTWSASASLQTDIRELLPLLNARLAGADYDHRAGVLVWKQEGHKYAFRPHEIKAAPARDRQEGLQMLERAVALVNEIWNEKDNIAPSYEKRTIPDMMAIYKLLPRSRGCKSCGFATCMAFAAALRDGKAELALCPVLEEAGHADERAQLREMMGLSA
jgi:ArsR family metal-binding transcriptional regulator